MENSSESESKMEGSQVEKGSEADVTESDEQETVEDQQHDEKHVGTSCQIPLSKSRVFFLNISWFGMNVMYLILSVEVVPSQVYALVGSENKGQVLGGMVAAGAVVTFFLSPLVGLKSDRLVSHYGKRRPLMLGGTILLCIALFGMAFSAPDIQSDISNVTCAIDLKLRRCIPYYNISVLEMSQDNATTDQDTSFLLSMLMQKEDSRGNVGLYVAFYLCVMACYTIMSVPYNGLIADLTPSFQRGFSSGVMGAMTLVGNVTGAGIGFFFPWSMILRSAVRKEKGLPILVELLRINHDPVVRAVATALRNLAIDPRNKVIEGKYATRDLVHRLPDPNTPTVKEQENTVGAILCAIHQLVNKSLENGRHVRDAGGIKKIVAIAKSKDQYSPKIVKTANQVLITLWNIPSLRNAIKKEGWEFTKEIGDEYGHAPPVPRPYEDITIPRGVQPPSSSTVGKNEPRPVRSDETSLPEPQRWEPETSRPPPKFAEDGYEADDDSRRRKGPREEMEMEDMSGYREIDNRSDPDRSARVLPPAYDSRQQQSEAKEDPVYAQVDKSKKPVYKLEGTDGPATDSWV